MITFNYPNTYISLFLRALIYSVWNEINNYQFLVWESGTHGAVSCWYLHGYQLYGSL